MHAVQDTIFGKDGSSTVTHVKMDLQNLHARNNVKFKRCLAIIIPQDYVGELEMEK
jgi:hypothetical protein